MRIHFQLHSHSVFRTENKNHVIRAIEPFETGREKTDEENNQHDLGSHEGQKEQRIQQTIGDQTQLPVGDEIGGKQRQHQQQPVAAHIAPQPQQQL